MSNFNLELDWVWRQSLIMNQTGLMSSFNHEPGLDLGLILA